MKDEIYPPPKLARKPALDDVQGQKPRSKRAMYSVLSLVFLVFAVALNFTNNTSLVSFKAKPDSLSRGSAEVGVRLQNRSAMTLYVSRYYTLELMQNSEWVEVASNSDAEFETVAFAIPRFSGQDLSFGRHGVFAPLAPGEYRIAIEIYAPSTFIGPAHSWTAYAEFTVTDSE